MRSIIGFLLSERTSWVSLVTFHISLISRPNSGWLNVQNSGIGNPKQQRMCFVFWIDWIYWPSLEQIGSKEHQRISTYKKVDLNMEVKVHLGVGDVHISLQCNVLTMQCFPILNNVIFRRCLKKTSTSMFLTMFEKTKTSCSRCILAMFSKRLIKFRNISQFFSNVKKRVCFSKHK